MKDDLYETLATEEFISAESLERLSTRNQNPLFSLHWELKTLLYLGVMLLSTGLGILIYKNIDTIGHQIILIVIAAISAGCFFYCFKHKKPFSKELVKSPNSTFDYLLLLACLSFLTFVGYLQFQYEVFGTNYGLATFIPMVVLFFVAYTFDHLGILSLAITNLALWLGLSITPAQLLNSGNFNSIQIIYTYLFLGVLLLSAGFTAAHFNFKKHFRFTYLHFGLHITYIALLSAYFVHYGPLSVVLILLIFGLSYYVYLDSVKHKSFYFLLLATLYGYIALSSLICTALFKGNDIGMIYLAFFYFIISAVAVGKLLIVLNKKIK